jgi:hypothetical protein
VRSGQSCGGPKVSIGLLPANRFSGPSCYPASHQPNAIISSDTIPAALARAFHPKEGFVIISRLAALPALLLMLAPFCYADAAASASLPDEPQPQTKSQKNNVPLVGHGQDNVVLNVHVGPAYPLKPDDKWDVIVNGGQQPEPLSRTDTLLYAAHEQVIPTVLIPALLSAGWGQLVDANPHVGTDSGGFGERIGYAMVRQATDRLTGDGLFAAALHQDPRFYRETNGPIVHRGLRAVRQTFMRRDGNDDGKERVNASGILGHALGNYLAMAYYPGESSDAGIATSGFATSVAGDMGSKLIQEFGPDLLRLAFRRNQ